MGRTMLDNAFLNLRTAEIILKNDEGDEEFCNMAAYHLQQATEMSLKYQLEREGIHFRKIHEIESLILLLRENNIDPAVTEYVDEHSEMLTAWEQKARYTLGYLTERRKVEAAVKEVGKSLELCRERYSVPFQREEEEPEIEVDVDPDDPPL